MSRKRSLDDLRALWPQWTAEADGGCWLWLRGRANGYGILGATALQPDPIQAHRAAFLLFLGEIPKGMVVHHCCETPLCVNPDHLELVTYKIHSRRHGASETCIRNHPLNWHTSPRGHRICRTCDMERNRRNRSVRSAA